MGYTASVILSLLPYSILLIALEFASSLSCYVTKILLHVFYVILDLLVILLCLRCGVENVYEVSSYY